MKYKTTLSILFLFNGLFLMAQPAEFVLAPSNQRLTGYSAVGNITLNGNPAVSGDWVGVFDPNLICSGFGPVVPFSGNGTFSISLAVDKPGDAPLDGGINCTLLGPNPPLAGSFINCETFTLVYWKQSTGEFYMYPTSAAPTSFSHVDADFDLRVDALQNNMQVLNFTGPALPPGALPVELLFFRGAPKDADVLLEWATASEQNNDFFEVQRSADGRDFEVLGKVAGAGTHSGLLTYDFTDRSPRPGVNYYRLRQVDFDGAFEYSPVVSVKADGKESGMALYPNPAGEYVEVSLPAAWSEGETELFLRDISGRVLRQMQFTNVDGPMRVSTEGLPGGYYTLQASNGRELLSERVVVMRP